MNDNLKKKTILFLIILSTVLLIHLWINVASFKEWMNAYAILYIGLFSVLIYSLKEKPMNEAINNKKSNENECLEIEDHLHWTGQISASIVFLIFAGLFMICII